MNDSIYIEVSSNDLETPEFSKKLKEIYAQNSSQDVFLVVDGVVLETPDTKRPIRKIGKNLYDDPESDVQYKRDDGTIESLKKFLDKSDNSSPIYELRDPHCGIPLKEIEDGVYDTGSGFAYIVTTEGMLEQTEFNDKLKRIESEYNGSVYLVIDGNELTDQICGGELKKIGTNLYQSPYSEGCYIMDESGKLIHLVDPISGAPLIPQEDGTYYSEHIKSHFSLGKAPDGNTVFFPNFLPYDGMLDVKASVIDNRLVGDNGISFPITESGCVEIPFEEGLKTQEQIDMSLKIKAALTRANIERIQQEMKGLELKMAELRENLSSVIKGDNQVTTKNVDRFLKFGNIYALVQEDGSAKDLEAIIQQLSEFEKDPLEQGRSDDEKV